MLYRDGIGHQQRRVKKTRSWRRMHLLVAYRRAMGKFGPIIAKEGWMKTLANRISRLGRKERHLAP